MQVAVLDPRAKSLDEDACLLEVHRLVLGVELQHAALHVVLDLRVSVVVHDLVERVVVVLYLDEGPLGRVLCVTLEVLNDDLVLGEVGSHDEELFEKYEVDVVRDITNVDFPLFHSDQNVIIVNNDN